jgi:tripartite-type tricarboxylate transporter receptor subunit TctC
MAGRNLALAAAIAAAAAVSAAPSGPAAAEDYYAGKTVRIVHGGGARGSYMMYARVFAQYLPKHLKGNPTVVADTMPGAGGMNANNYGYNAAPKDGSVLLMPLPGVATADLLYGAKARFDPRKFEWIGHITGLQSAVGVWKTAPATTIEQAQKTEVVLGSTGAASEVTLVPQLMNAVLGTKFKIILGYKGIGEVNLAMEKHEVEGRGGGMTSWHPLKPDWFKPEQKIAFMAQLGLKRHPLIPDVPLLSEFAKNDDDRKVLELAARATVLSRAVAAPPGTPAERVKELRAAFEGVMKDPGYQADMKKHDLMMVNQMTVEEIDQFFADTQATPKPVVERLKTMLGIKS